MTRSLLAAGLLAIALSASACGSDGSGSGGGYGGDEVTKASPSSSAEAGAADEARITIKGFQFGAALTVKPGAKIEVYNEDSAPHTVTADDGTSFDVKVPSGDEAVLTAPATAGTYAFHCAVHPTMTGSLVVQ